MRKSSNVATSSRSQAPKVVKLKLTTQYAAHADSIPSRIEFRKWIKAALKHDAEIVLRIVDETEGHSLNRDFRGRDYATNVLTFVYDTVRPNSPHLAGDIVLCAPVIEDEARKQHKSVSAHYAHLAVHGVLHLQGYDHEGGEEAAVMEKLESEIVGRLGYEDPYKAYG